MLKLMRLPAVMQQTGLSRSSIYLQISKGLFPASIRITRGAVGWSSAEIEKWVELKIQDRNATENSANVREVV